MPTTPIDPKPLIYSPIQASNYTAVEYTIPLTGAAPDLSPLFMGTQYLASAQNMVIRSGKVVSREGTRSLGTAIGQNYLAATEFIMHSGQARLLVAHNDGVRYYNKTTDSLVNIMASAWTTVSQGANVDWVPMRTATSGLRLIVVPESLPLATQEPFRWWTGATTDSAIVLTTSVQGNCAITWKSHFLAGDTTDTGDGAVPYRVHWSALGDPTVWFGTASAGSIDLLDKNASRVMRFLPLRRILLAYKQFGVHSLTYKASPFYFTQALESEQINILSRSAVCAVAGGDMHFLLTTDGVLLWDGQTVKPIGRNRVDKSILAELDWGSPTRIHASYWPITQEVYLTYALSDGSTNTWVYNLEFDSWWQSTLRPVNAAQVYRVFSTGAAQFVSANINQSADRLCALFVGNSDALTSATNAPYTATFATPPLDFGSFAHKRTKNIHPIFRLNTAAGAFSTSVSLSFRQYEHPLDISTTGATTIVMPLATTEPLPLPEVSQHFSSRYISIGTTYTSTSGQLEVGSIVFLPTLRTDVREGR